MLQFDISKLKEGDVQEKIATPSPEQLELDTEKFSDIKVIVHLEKIEDRIQVAFDVRATARLQGDRTLEWYDEPIEESFALTFKPPREITENDREDDAVRELAPFDTDIDIGAEVRDSILLGVPLRQIAPGGEEIELELEHGKPSEEEQLEDRPEWKQKLEQLREEADTD